MNRWKLVSWLAVLFVKLQKYVGIGWRIITKWWLDSNCGSLVSKATARPTVPKPKTSANSFFTFCLSIAFSFVRQLAPKSVYFHSPGPVWPVKKLPNVCKSCPKMISLKNEILQQLYKSCQKMWAIWAKLLLHQALKSCPKCNKSPNLATLLHSLRRISILKENEKLRKQKQTQTSTFEWTNFNQKKYYFFFPTTFRTIQSLSLACLLALRLRDSSSL